MQFIKKFDYPITREDVYKEFPGLTDIVLNIAAADPDVLNLFGKYTARLFASKRAFCFSCCLDFPSLFFLVAFLLM